LYRSYLFISFFLPHNFGSEVIPIPEEVVVGDETLQGVTNEIYEEWPQRNSESCKVKEAKMTMVNGGPPLRPT
jgi:hypothetical protein